MTDVAPSRRTEWLRTWWVCVPPLSLGMLSWAVFLYAGLRAGRRRWLAYAAGYAVLCTAAVVCVTLGGARDGGLNEIGGFLFIASAAAGFAHAIAIRQDFLMSTAAIGDARLEAAERRLAVQDRGRRLVATDPARARRLGVGRPDVPDAFDAGLVDINSAPADTLERVPGIDAALARRIVAVREELGRFSSVDDLDLLLDLPRPVLDGLRDGAVFVP